MDIKYLITHSGGFHADGTIIISCTQISLS